jgi:cell cycle serine/threonine-protein kinase CDC5/MSD2
LRGRGLANIAEEEGVLFREKGEEEIRKKELEAQKARIVAQMAPREEEMPARDQENVPPGKRTREKRPRDECKYIYFV